jgi:hypothetical protein
MTNLLHRFTKAAKVVSSDSTPIRECVYGAYRDHLSNIISDDLPEEIQIIYESVSDRLTSIEPPGDIGIDEVNYLARDILYMADAVQAHYKKS